MAGSTPRPKKIVQSDSGESIASYGPPTGDPRVKVVFIQDPSKMVTLEDPNGGVQEARGAFARLRPPEDLPEDQTRSWADSVRAIARAVRVLPTRRSATLSTSTRVDVAPSTTIREEIARLITEANDPELSALNEEILSAAERS